MLLSVASFARADPWIDKSRIANVSKPVVRWPDRFMVVSLDFKG
jgi:hypothetical protein